ncbi:PAS domain S-box protein [Desulfosporosinus sp. OT]|uniref:two-component system sensor histidine kinase NtrB n=1 Tax=Desulfosporosinus sp. OT TaxID=913865 RepID=UPI000223A413|nr:PAS domain S-box protein [Desulfosporosinus sp. OT]EGW39939.1 sensory box protein [Desulfosporosinus sp. OT]
MGLIKRNRADLLGELEEEFWKGQIYTNFPRLRLLATLLLICDIILLFVDHGNYQKGLWLSTPGYKLLFYSHLGLGGGMLLFTALYWNTKIPSVDDVKWIHEIYENFFAFFSLFICTITSGWIDQLIHGQLTVYILGCFVIAVFFNLRPKVSIGVYAISYLIIMFEITHQQPNVDVLKGHYINVSLIIIIAWFLSFTLYKFRVQEFLHQSHFEWLVKERTTELEGINQQLIKEVGERKQIEEKVLRLASIVESTDDGIIGMTLDGIIIDWNRGAECIYGYSEAEIIGEPIKKIIPLDKQLEFDKVLQIIFHGMPVTHYEAIRQRKDEKFIHVYLTVSPIKGHNGEIIGASTIVKDVTAQKKLEKEMTRMDQMNLVGEMAASIGHEVRNPMTTVRGFLQLIQEHKSFDKYSDYIPLMISELDRANSIITKFLSISRTKTTELALHNLNDIIESILPLVQVDAIRGDKLVTAELGVLPDLLLDEKEILQMILNLTRNGLEAMEEEGALVIKTLVEDDEVVLAIQDEGKGIAPEIMDSLGTPFFTTKEKGTGLGLAVCYGIATRHNAKIKVETSPNGSTFFVKFKA